MGNDARAVAGNNEERCRGGVLFWCRSECGVGRVAEVVLAEDVVRGAKVGKYVQDVKELGLLCLECG